MRLKQQYFWVAASLYDIVRRFKKSKRAWSEFPEQVAIQLNDTHPTLAIVELQRILIDVEGLPWDQAWNIVTNTVSETRHSLYSMVLIRRLVWLHQPYRPSGGPREVARQPVAEPFAQTSADHLRH